jgi:hypothetical protein
MPGTDEEFLHQVLPGDHGYKRARADHRIYIPQPALLGACSNAIRDKIQRRGQRIMYKPLR